MCFLFLFMCISTFVMEVGKFRKPIYRMKDKHFFSRLFYIFCPFFRCLCTKSVEWTFAMDRVRHFTVLQYCFSWMYIKNNRRKKGFKSIKILLLYWMFRIMCITENDEIVITKNILNNLDLNVVYKLIFCKILAFFSNALTLVSSIKKIK